MGPYDSPYITDSQGHSGIPLVSLVMHRHSRLAALGLACLPRYAVFFYSWDYSFFVLYTGIQRERLVPRRLQRSTALHEHLLDSDGCGLVVRACHTPHGGPSLS